MLYWIDKLGALRYYFTVLIKNLLLFHKFGKYFPQEIGYIFLVQTFLDSLIYHNACVFRPHIAHGTPGLWSEQRSCRTDRSLCSTPHIWWSRVKGCTSTPLVRHAPSTPLAIPSPRVTEGFLTTNTVSILRTIYRNPYFEMLLSIPPPSQKNN